MESQILYTGKDIKHKKYAAWLLIKYVRWFIKGKYFFLEQYEKKNQIRQSNQRNQDSSEIQKNVIQGQRPDMENRQTWQGA